MKKPFTKRSFTLPLLARSLGGAAAHLPVMAKALVRPRLSPALREKIMLGVTSVNDCRYCYWVHSGLALEQGVDLDDLAVLLDGDLGADTTEAEAVAILYAKHFADTQGRPSAGARARLAEHYDAAARREISAYVQTLLFTNLTGNSADALLARLRGRPVGGGERGGDLAGQVAAGLIGAPVLAAIWCYSLRSGRRAMDSL